jgi:hypothetical protein
MPYLPLIVCLAFAVFFYRAAEVEDESTWIWCGLSILISALTLFWLHWGWLGIILGQFGILAGIVCLRIWRDRE